MSIVALLQYPVFLHFVDHLDLNDYYNLCLVNYDFYSMCVENGISKRFKDRVLNRVLDVIILEGGFLGEIVTEQFTLKWVYEDEYRCCERFYVNVHGIILLRNQYLIKYQMNDVNYVKSPGKGFDIVVNADVDIIFKTDKYIFKVGFYNQHNGYYSHNLDVYIDDELKWNVSI